MKYNVGTKLKHKTNNQVIEIMEIRDLTEYKELWEIFKPSSRYYYICTYQSYPWDFGVNEKDLENDYAVFLS